MSGWRPGPYCFLRCTGLRTRQRLARTGKNLTWPGGRRCRPDGNRNAARRGRGRDRSLRNMPRNVSWLSRGKRRAQRGRSRSRGRSLSLRGNLPGWLRSLRYRFMFGSRGHPRRFGENFRCVFRGGFRFRRSGATCSGRAWRSVRFPCQPALDLYRDRFIDRAGVGFLFRYAQLGKHVEDHVGFHLELACQLVNSNFDHTVCPAVQFRHRGCQIKPCSLSGASAPTGDSAISIVTDCSCGASADRSPAAATGSAGAPSPSPPDSNCP
jgi:hypothetical protein